MPLPTRRHLETASLWRPLLPKVTVTATDLSAHNPASATDGQRGCDHGIPLPQRLLRRPTRYSRQALGGLRPRPATARPLLSERRGTAAAHALPRHPGEGPFLAPPRREEDGLTAAAAPGRDPAGGTRRCQAGRVAMAPSPPSFPLPGLRDRKPPPRALWTGKSLRRPGRTRFEWNPADSRRPGPRRRGRGGLRAEVRARRDGRPGHRDPRGPGAALGGLAAARGGLCVAAAAGVGPAGSGPERRAVRRVAGMGAAPSPPRAASGGGGGQRRFSPRGAPARAGSTLGPAVPAVPGRACAGPDGRTFERPRAAAVLGRPACAQAAGGGRAAGYPRRRGGPPGPRRLTGPGRPCLFPAESSRRVWPRRRPVLQPLAGVSGRRVPRGVPPSGSLSCGRFPVRGTRRIETLPLLERSAAAVPGGVGLEVRGGGRGSQGKARAGVRGGGEIFNPCRERRSRSE